MHRLVRVTLSDKEKYKFSLLAFALGKLFLIEPILEFCEGSTRPQLELTFAENIPWNDVSLILHTKYDFPDANLLNGYTGLLNLKENKKLHLLEIRKIISKRVSTRNTPCSPVEHQTCLNIEDNKMVLEKFKCQIPILNYGHHLESLIPKETQACSNEVTREAFNLIQAVRYKSNL